MKSWKTALRRFRGAWLCLAVLSLLSAASELTLSHSVTTDQRPTPELHRVAPVLEVALPTLWFGIVLFRARREQQSSGPRFVLLASALHVALVLFAFATTLALVLVVDGLKLFEPVWLEPSTLRAAGRVGYVYTRGLLCGYDVYERKSWTLTLRHVSSVSTRGCDRQKLPELAWNASKGHFELVLKNPHERFGPDSFGILFH